MSYHEGNKFAEKWTIETVKPLVDQIHNIAQKDDCIYLGDALVRLNLYKDVWAYWKDKFADCEDVFRTIKAVDQIFEKKLFVGGLSGIHNPTMAIFGLKNNHGWVDKTENVNTTDLNINWQETKTYDGANEKAD